MKLTPVLLITFNRPQHTQRVLEAILAAGVDELFVFQDGAREGNDNDMQRCKEVQEIVTLTIQKIAPSITIHTYYSQCNLGCGMGPYTALQWFFDNVESGIIIEDDCIPHIDFFPYCTELLQRYQNNTDVLVINGCVYHDRWKPKGQYGFSHYLVPGAWAGWRRTLQGYDYELKDLKPWDFRKYLKTLLKDKFEIDSWYFKLKEIQLDEVKHYWDYQLQISMFLRKGYTIHPAVNLISNIGFDEAGTHTTYDDGRANIPVKSIMPLSADTPQPSAENVNLDLQVDPQWFIGAVKCSPFKRWRRFIYNYLYYSKGIGHNMIACYSTWRNKEKEKRR